MPEALCEPFAACDGLDGRLLISSVIQGPPLAWDLGEVSFGTFTSTGAAARPYVDVRLEQTWTAREACYGPIRSIFSLAPGETVQIAVSVRHELSLTSVVSSASSDVRSVQGPDVSAQKGGGGLMSQLQEQLAIVQMQTKYAQAYGSFLEGLANVLLPGVGGAVVDAAEGLANHVDNTMAGAASAVHGAMQGAAQTIETIRRTESQRSSTSSTTTSETTETVQTLTRTFSNPYRDRSLQLRFIPVFRHFEVRTWPSYVKPGIALQVGAARAEAANPVRIRDVLAAAPAHVDAGALQLPLARMLSGGAAETRLLGTRAAAGTAGAAAIGAFSWSQSAVQDDSVLVPLAEPALAAKAFGLKGQARSSFLGSLDRLRPEAVVKLVPANVQDVHLFMGTHIEAVAGECVLADLPPLPQPADPD